MKEKHFRFHKIVFLMLFLCCICSCENRRDINGDLDGMWQLVEWRDSQGNIIEDKNCRIFYSIQLKLIQFRDFDDPGVASSHVHAYFRHTPDSLVIFYPVNYGSKEPIPLESLKKYAVPSDGGFRIDALNKSHMLLSSKENKLVFRKY